MLPENVKKKLSKNLRLESMKEYYDELEVAKKNGYKIPNIDFDSLLITQDQAANIMMKLSVSCDSVNLMGHAS